jgi:hypothetical protein
MANRRDLKSYVRYDGSGRVIPGSNVLRKNMPKVGNWKEIQAYECCDPTPPPTINALRLTFDSIENADLLVGDSSSVEDWNTFFDLPTLGSPFTSVQVEGNEIKLYGGANIKVKPALMYDFGYQYLISINDEAGCITSVGGDAFSYCEYLTSVSLPECTIIYGYEDSPENGYGGFGYCISLANINIPKLVTLGSYGLTDCIATSINFPLLTTVEDSGLTWFSNVTSITLPSLETIDFEGLAYNNATSYFFPNVTSIGFQAFTSCTSLTTISIPSCTDLGGTVGDDGVFNSLSGNNVTLTVPAALMTCNSGNPDGDIQYLQANNTVTVITV